MELVVIFVADRWQVFVGSRDKVYAFGDHSFSWVYSSLSFMFYVSRQNV